MGSLGSVEPFTQMGDPEHPLLVINSHLPLLPPQVLISSCPSHSWPRRRIFGSCRVERRERLKERMQSSFGRGFVIQVRGWNCVGGTYPTLIGWAFAFDACGS
jgi:hypothetical protein